MTGPAGRGTTLRWAWPHRAPAELEAGLVGPGGPFEMQVDEVLGQEVAVFVNRSPSLRHTLARSAEAHGDRPHLVFTGRPDDDRTFAELRDDVARWASMLAGAYGVGPGDRVAVASANCLDHVLVAHATAALGAVAVGVNGWWTAAEMADALDLTAPALVVGDGPRLDRLRQAGSPWGRRCLTFDELDRPDRSAAAPALPDVPLAEDDPVIILFTSGTTGRSKGAVLTHRNLGHMALSSALAAALARVTPPAAAPPEGQAAAILSAPFFHVSGVVPLFVSGLSFGVKLVLPPAGRWDEAAHLRLTAEHRVSSWSTVPTQLWRLLEHPDFAMTDTSSLRTVAVGGALAPVELVRRVAELLPDVRLTNGYGMTETLGGGTRAAGADLVEHPGSVGVADPGAEIQVRAGDGATVVPDGEVGEIHVRGATVFRGYWDDPGADAACFDDRRWYRSGDFGRIDEGRLYLASRVRDLIIRGGENVYPLEIENRLVEHPDIEEAAVIGVDHRILGQEVAAVLVLRPGASVDAASVQAWCAASLAPFKVPAHVRVVDALPMTASGKVMKHVLEAELAPPTG